MGSPSSNQYSVCSCGSGSNCGCGENCLRVLDQVSNDVAFNAGICWPLGFLVYVVDGPAPGPYIGNDQGGLDPFGGGVSQAQLNALQNQVNQNTTLLANFLGQNVLLNPTYYIRPSGDNQLDGLSLQDALQNWSGLTSKLNGALIIGDVTIDAQGSFGTLRFNPSLFNGARTVFLRGDPSNIGALTIDWGGSTTSSFDSGIIVSAGTTLTMSDMTLNASPTSAFANALRVVDGSRLNVDGNLRFTGNLSANQQLCFASGGGTIQTVNDGSAAPTVWELFLAGSPSSIVSAQGGSVVLQDTQISIQSQLNISDAVFFATQGGSIKVGSSPSPGYATDAGGAGQFIGRVTSIFGVGSSMSSFGIPGLTQSNLHTRFRATGSIQQSDVGIGAALEFSNGLRHGQTGTFV